MATPKQHPQELDVGPPSPGRVWARDRATCAGSQRLAMITGFNRRHRTGHPVKGCEGRYLLQSITWKRSLWRRRSALVVLHSYDREFTCGRAYSHRGPTATSHLETGVSSARWVVSAGGFERGAPAAGSAGPTDRCAVERDARRIDGVRFSGNGDFPRASRCRAAVVGVPGASDTRAWSAVPAVGAASRRGPDLDRSPTHVPNSNARTQLSRLWAGDARIHTREAQTTEVSRSPTLHASERGRQVIEDC